MLVLGTTNQGKVRELLELLHGEFVEVGFVQKRYYLPGVCSPEGFKLKLPDGSD